MEWTPAERAQIDAAAQLRRATHLLVGGDHDAATLQTVADSIESAIAPLKNAGARTRRDEKWANPETIEAPADNTVFEGSLDRPVSGPGNPWSIPLEVVRRGDRAVTTATLEAACEGAPARAHGGVVSAIFDDLCGFLLTLNLTMAFTASLTVNYHAATPLDEPLTFAAWVERTEGRKLHLRGECRRGVEDPTGELLTSCTALFITVDRLIDGTSPADHPTN